MKRLDKIKKIMLVAVLLLLAANFVNLTLPAVPAYAEEQDQAQRPVYLVEVEGAITAGQKNFLQRQFDEALDMEAQLLVVRINTPGGLVDATMEINELFLNAPIPVAVLVAPSGAIAGSAGAFILMASDIAAMAPGTTVGAAQPVAISPEGTEATDEKTVAFYASYMRNTAEEQGRPGDVAERFVTENLTLGAREALEKDMIEYLAGSVQELMVAVDGQEIEKLGEVYRLNTAEAPIEQDEMTVGERFQNWLSDPQIAFLVLMAGFLGIYFGLSAPGTIVPEVGGVILLIMGIYGIGLFDVNTTGIILLLLGLGLIAAEIFTAGFGVLGIGGALSMLAGAIMLPVEPLMEADWYTTFLITVVGVVIGLLVVILVVVQRIVHSRRQWTGGSAHFNPPDKGVVTTDLDPEGMIRARGEYWRSRSEDGSKIQAGKEVKVVKAETLLLWVRPLEDEKDTNNIS